MSNFLEIIARHKSDYICKTGKLGVDVDTWGVEVGMTPMRSVNAESKIFGAQFN